MLEVQPMENSALLSLKGGPGQEKFTRVERGGTDFTKITSKDKLWCTFCKSPDTQLMSARNFMVNQKKRDNQRGRLM